MYMDRTFMFLERFFRLNPDKALEGVPINNAIFISNNKCHFARNHEACLFMRMIVNKEYQRILES